MLASKSFYEDIFKEKDDMITSLSRNLKLYKRENDKLKLQNIELLRESRKYHENVSDLKGK